MRCVLAMITLRTLKKKSKQAVEILQRHYPRDIEGELFLSKRHENYHEYIIRCTHGAGDPAYGKRPHCDCTYHPLKGTPMFGGVSGYYEPEWEEKTALSVLQSAVEWNDRPETMTDREWKRTLRISGVKPVTEEDLAEWMRGPSDDETP